MSYYTTVRAANGKRFVSSSLLKRVGTTGPDPDKYALDFGEYFHGLTLEPGKWVGKSPLVKSKDLPIVNAMRLAVWWYVGGGTWFTSRALNYIEKEFYRVLDLQIGQEKRRYWLKGKIDHMPKHPKEGVRLITDLKSTSAYSQPSFEAACLKYDYYMQAFVYMLLARENKCLLLGVQKKLQPEIYPVFVEKGDDNYMQGQIAFLEKLIQLDQSHYEVIA
jgi:hypothetical protein